MEHLNKKIIKKDDFMTVNLKYEPIIPTEEELSLFEMQMNFTGNINHDDKTKYPELFTDDITQTECETYGIDKSLLDNPYLVNPATIDRNFRYYHYNQSKPQSESRQPVSQTEIKQPVIVNRQKQKRIKICYVVLNNNPHLKCKACNTIYAYQVVDSYTKYKSVQNGGNDDYHHYGDFCLDCFYQIIEKGNKTDNERQWLYWLIDDNRC
jgi:hypothetical protein